MNAMTLGALHMLIEGKSENFCCILLDRNITVVYWMGVQMFAERGIQSPSSQRYTDCSYDQLSFLGSRFTTSTSSVRMGLGHLPTFPPDSYHEDADEPAEQGKTLAPDPHEKPEQLLGYQQPSPAADSCSAHSFCCTQLLQGMRPVGFLSPYHGQSLLGRHHPPGLIFPEFCQPRTTVTSLLFTEPRLCRLHQGVHPRHGAKCQLSRRCSWVLVAPCVCFFYIL